MKDVSLKKYLPSQRAPQSPLPSSPLLFSEPDSDIIPPTEISLLEKVLGNIMTTFCSFTATSKINHSSVGISKRKHDI